MLPHYTRYEKLPPYSLAVGCEKCPAFKFCPLTTVLGDQEKGGNGSSRRADLYNKIEEEKPKTDEEDKYQKYAEEELEKNKKEEPKWGDSG